MPDWRELVRQRLSGLALDAEEKDEVQVELAAHLEESYEVFCKEGLPEREALHRTFEQGADCLEFPLTSSSLIQSYAHMKKRIAPAWGPRYVGQLISIHYIRGHLQL